MVSERRSHVPTRRSPSTKSAQDTAPGTASNPIASTGLGSSLQCRPLLPAGLLPLVFYSASWRLNSDHLQAIARTATTHSAEPAPQSCGDFIGERVSIITPAFRAATYISETIRSVQAQDYLDWEMLVVDDQSPDHTAELIAEHAAEDPRIHLIRQTKNGGPAAARNAALAQARGRWVAFLDSDDLWLPNKLSEQLKFHRAHGGVLSFTAFRRMSADGSRLGRLIEVPARLSYARLLRNTAIATSTVIVDRAVCGPFCMKRTYYDDYACWLALLRPGPQAGGIAHGLNEDLMRYRVLDRSVSRNKSNSARQVWKVYREVERLNPIHAAWCFAHYGARGWLKYRRF